MKLFLTIFYYLIIIPFSKVFWFNKEERKRLSINDSLDTYWQDSKSYSSMKHQK